MPPVVVIAPEIDPADIVQAFSGGPVSYRLEGSSQPVRNNLTRIFPKLHVRRQTEVVLRWRGLA